MQIERLILENFRCFGPTAESIDLSSGLTALVGLNGAGKTAMMQALLRLFGITREQRSICRIDFHIPANESTPPSERTLSIEAILVFPELESDHPESTMAVPEFFSQMAANQDGKLKCRIRLDATWTDDGTTEGSIEWKFRAVRTLESEFEEEECSNISPVDRRRIQMIYVPARRDGVSQVSAFLKGRIWRAITWSEEMSTCIDQAHEQIHRTFDSEPAISTITNVLKTRWQEVHTAGTDTAPLLRLFDPRQHELTRKANVMFFPTEAGDERSIDDLSDGQRSLFHIAMTAATIDIEDEIIGSTGDSGFDRNAIAPPSLTILAIEEPENNLAPFFLSRIIHQVLDLTKNPRAQAVISSHSASIMARINPEDVRHFQLVDARIAKVNKITLPDDPEYAAKYVREAVQTYPELYFARFAILGEGSSEEVVLPRLAEALEFPIDRSFVAIVPLGGRHVNHLWKLCNDLDIPHATLLDLDLGRYGGGWGRIKNICERLIENGTDGNTLLSLNGTEETISLTTFDNYDNTDRTQLNAWLAHLRNFGVYFCAPLDLDMTMLRAYQTQYQDLDDGRRGPTQDSNAKSAVLGSNGTPNLYEGSREVEWNELFRWYRYLFLGRGKPSTHIRVLSQMGMTEIAADAPGSLKKLLESVANKLEITSDTVVTET
jgi:putative ATP-dependent endonuclease of OLD family